MELAISLSTPEFVNLRACQLPCSIASLWIGGSITGNVFTAQDHSTITATTTRPTAEPCPVMLTLEVDSDDTQHVRWQLQGLLAALPVSGRDRMGPSVALSRRRSGLDTIRTTSSF